jgi:crotonobetainyl-CoA:carnitine CoA-transferase CaiB-like acyl-CoA transferase
MKHSSLPLTGVTVVDLSRILAGPLAAQLLGDLGADVIKVESPQGDPTRGWGPPFKQGVSAYYLSCNRNKRGVIADFKTEAGREKVRALVRSADLVVENFLSGDLEKFGLGYAQLKKINPKIGWVSITGFGPAGPLKNDPGYDFLMQAMSGWMSVTGPVAGPPHKVGMALADVLCGLYAANAAQALLFQIKATGQGGRLEVPLYAAALSGLINVAQNHLLTGKDGARYGNGHPSIVPYQSFHAKDGEIAIAVGSEAQFARLAKLLGKPEWADDPRYSANPARVKNRKALLQQMAAIVKRKPARHWIAACNKAGIPAGPVQSVAGALGHAQTKALGLIQSLPHPELGKVKLLSAPIFQNDKPLPIRRAPPRLNHSK